MYRAHDYSLRDYGKMVADVGRSQPFIDALRRLVQPGAVVLDIGTGFGYFAFLAAQFGAARVYAVEPDNSIEVARACSRDILGSDRISWIQGLSTEIDLPEKADIVIGDLHGTLPFYTGNIPSLIDARRRHLKAGGTIIPARDVLHVVPAQAPHEYRTVDTPWQRDIAGLDLRVGRSFVINEWWRARREPARDQDLLSAPATWGVIDYGMAESANVDGNLSWAIERSGIMHGYYVWFDGEVAEGIGFSNAPNLPELVYGRAFFPLEQAVDVVVGDRVEAHMSVRLIGGDYVYRWDTRISDSEGNTNASFKQSTLRSKPINLQQLRRTQPEYVPTLGIDGRIARMVIEGIEQAQPLGQIAETLSTQFPQRFKDASMALDHAVRLSMKYSDHS